MKSEKITIQNKNEASIQACESRLRALGLSEPQLEELGATIDVIGDILLDKYFSLYE